MENEKVKLVVKEYERLIDIFKNIDENKLEFVKHQVHELAWLNITCDELKKRIDKIGASVEYDNGGGQKGYTSNPDVKALIAYQKNTATIIKQLIDIVPTCQEKSKLEDFLM